MNANSIVLFLGVVSFVFITLFVLAMEGVFLASASLAILLVIAFVVSLLIYLVVTRSDYETKRVASKATLKMFV